MSEPHERIAEVYVHMYDFLLDYAEIALSNHALAEEAVQETFEIACQKQEELSKCSRPEAWVLNRMKTVIANQKRDRVADSNLLQRLAIVISRADCPGLFLSSELKWAERALGVGATCASWARFAVRFGGMQ